MLLAAVRFGAMSLAVGWERTRAQFALGIVATRFILNAKGLVVSVAPRTVQINRGVYSEDPDTGHRMPQVQKLSANAEEAISDSGVDAQVEKIADLPEIMEFGVMTTPALAIDGEVKATGKVLRVQQIEDILKEE